MEVDGIFVSKAQEIADASIVDGEIDGSGNLVLTTGGGTEINAGLARPNSIVDGEIVGNNLILERFDETTFDAGQVIFPQLEPGKATWLSSGVMDEAPTGAGTFWYTPVFTGALSDVVEYGGVGAEYQASGSAGIKVMEDGVYDVSAYVWTNSGYPVGNIVGIRLVTPSAGMDNYAEFGTKPPNLVSGAANIHAFRKSLAANSVVAMQIHATNAGGVAWNDWRAMIQVRKSW